MEVDPNLERERAIARRIQAPDQAGLDSDGGQPAAELLSGMQHTVQITSQHLLANVSGSIGSGGSGHCQGPLGRWRCRNQHCDRSIFTERVPGLAAPFARRTARLAGIVRLLGHSAGGRPSERLMRRLGTPVSDTTILAGLRQHARAQSESSAVAAVHVAGVDDWAWRKGSNYGTIIDGLKAASVEFTAMRRLAMRFRGLLRGGMVEELDAWLIEARASGIYAMQRLARTIRQDLEAVRNAVSEPWSNGQTGGQINKLKTLKRAMYGRAGVDLLRAWMMPL